MAKCCGMPVLVGVRHEWLCPTSSLWLWGGCTWCYLHDGRAVVAPEGWVGIIWLLLDLHYDILYLVVCCIFLISCRVFFSVWLLYLCRAIWLVIIIHSSGQIVNLYSIFKAWTVKRPRRAFWYGRNSGVRITMGWRQKRKDPPLFGSCSRLINNAKADSTCGKHRRYEKKVVNK